MLDLYKIEDTIEELEARGDTTYSLCERLAWLYVVRDHLRQNVEDPKTQDLRGSEFLEACSGVSYPMLMRVLNEHMEALRAVQPREYQLVLGKVQDLKNL